MKVAEAIYRQDGPEAALPHFEALAKHFAMDRDEQSEATALHFVGECHMRLGDFATARDFLDTALNIRRAHRDRLGEGKTLNVLGLLEWELGAYNQAIALFHSVSNIGAELGEPRLEGAALNNLSLVYDELGDYQTSLEQYERVLEIYRGANFPRGEGDTYSNIGGVYQLLGQYRKALEYYERSLAISEQLESQMTLGLDHGNIGLVYIGLGELDTAIAHLDQAIAIAIQTGMEYDAAIWQRGKGNALIRKGRLDEGLEHHRLALATYEQIGAKAELLGALHDMGRLHLDLGDLASAEKYFEQAISLAHDIGHERGITINLIALGDLYFRREQWDEAASRFNQARLRADQSGEKSQLADSWLGLAYVHRALGRFEEAGRESQEALARAREIEGRQQEAEALYLLAEIERQTERFETALDLLAAVEAIISDTGDPDLLWQVHYSRAQVLEAQDDKLGAIDALKKAVLLIEGVRNRLREERFRTGYLQDKHQVYVELVRLQLELDMAEDAFDIAERLRARSYEKQYEHAGTLGLSESDRRRESELRERIRQLQRAIFEEQEQTHQRQAAIQTFSKELMQAEREYQAFFDDHQTRMPPPDLTVPGRSSSDIRMQLAADELLIEYVVGRDVVMLFALSRERLYTTIRPARIKDMQARIGLLRDLIDPTFGERWLKPAQSLAKVLIEPLEDDGILEGVNHLYLVPHGILNYLPFAILPVRSLDEQRLIVDEFTLSHLPTAIVQSPRETDATGPANLLALAPSRSRLRYAPDEARSINALFEPHSRLLIGESATESRFKRLAGDYRILHLATHSDFNKLNPMFSGLQLEPDDANDGRLEVYEVLRLELDADLVTLSACDTALGSGYFAQIPAGDEFVGLTRAFLTVGSDAVLATLWEVDDRSSVKFMQQFYSRLEKLGANMDKAAALNDAQQRFRASTDYEHPYYWAPFVLVGKLQEIAQPQDLEATL